MKRLQYSRDDINAWAEFSGDFNPVHFDQDVAARIGLPDVPVHGMRVMLDVKSVIHREACASLVAAHEPLLFKASLRAPVLRDRPYQLRIDPDGNRLKFSVQDDISGEACISGCLRPATLKEAAGDHATARIDTATFRFTPEKDALLRAMTRLTSLLDQDQDQAQPAWILLDALLFRHLLLHDSAFFGAIARVFGIAGVRSASALMRNVSVLQTHHATLIPPHAKSLTLDTLVEAAGAERVHLEIEPPEMTGDASSGLAISGSLAAGIGDMQFTRTSIGLLALPPHSPPQLQEC